MFPAAVYLLLLAYIYATQQQQVFHPRPGNEVTPDKAGLAYEDLRLNTPDGERLHAWWLPAQNARGSLLFLHGNAGNIGNRLESLRIFNGLGLNVLILDYRGYGHSSGEPGEQGIYTDAMTGWRWMTEIRGLQPESILLFGRSLGSAVAAELATRVRAGGLMLESPFTSIPDMAAELYPYLPVKQLARYQFDTLSKIDAIDEPLLVVHSSEDGLVPFSHGQQLFAAASEPKSFLEIRGSHNRGYLQSGKTYTDGVGGFIDSLGWR